MKVGYLRVHQKKRKRDNDLLNNTRRPNISIRNKPDLDDLKNDARSTMFKVPA